MIQDLVELYKLIRRFEGCKLVPYLCPARVWTCGWGSTGRDVIPGRAWTQEYADRRMESDALRFAKAALRLCPTLGKRAKALCAVADFAYNLGEHALEHSTLRRKINEEDMAAAKRELSKWVNGGGRRLPGLVLRRAAECELLEAA
jgi:lysozyme